MMIFRQIEKQDVETIRGLYKKFPDFQTPLKAMLPGDGMDGYVALKDGKIVGATYAFIAANAPYAWLEWTVGDRDYQEEDKEVIMTYLLEYACEDLQENGYKWCFAFANKEQHLIPIYEKAGFDVESLATYEMIKTLDNGK